MKTNLLIGAIIVAATVALNAATNDLSTVLQRGLLEEEANHNLDAAIQAYQSVATQFDKDRKLAATAIFRLGECYRKQGNTNAATAQYERIVREFSDQASFVDLSRQGLAAFGAQSAIVTAVDSSRAAAEAELKKASSQLADLESYSGEAKRTYVQQRFPNPLLNSLMEQRTLLAQKLIAASAVNGSQHPEVVVLHEQIGDLNRLIDEQVTEVVRDLTRRRDAAQAVVVAASPQSAPEAGNSAADDREEIRRIRNLIQESPDLVNAPDRNGETLLQSAAAKGKLKVVEYLLGRGAAVNGIQESGPTPLHYAAANGHMAVVALLLTNGAAPNARTQRGVTPLHLAAMKGYTAVSKALLAAGASVNAQTDQHETREGDDLRYDIQDGKTPLHLAAERGYAAVVELLLAKNADANVEDKEGETALGYAAQTRHDAVLKLLLAAHADPNAGHQNLPLLAAVAHDDLPVLRLLLTNGANPNARCSANYVLQLTMVGQFSDRTFSPFSLAVGKRKPKIVTELIHFKADPNSPGPGGEPIFFRALDDPPTLRALLDGGADPDKPKEDGTTALGVAASNNKLQDAVELLIAHHANVNTTNRDGWTPLHGAAMNNAPACAELLVKNGANVNAAESIGGSTPLHTAVQHGNREIAEFLLANKADPNLRNNQGLTPLDLAKLQEARPLPPPYPGMPRSIPARSIRLPGAPPEPAETTALSLADLLRKHGAIDDLPNFSIIRIECKDIKSGPWEVFKSDTNSLNHFSLLETILNGPNIHYRDFTRIKIHRPIRGEAGQEKTLDADPITDNMATGGADLVPTRPNGTPITRGPLVRMNTFACAKDVWLEFGDVVEIPEREHTLTEPQNYLTDEQKKSLTDCLARKVTFVVRGEKVEQEFHGSLSDSYLSTALQKSQVQKILRSSSDFSRVKIKRTDPVSHKPLEITQNIQAIFDRKQSYTDSLWLRDGDVVEVPDKP